MTTIDRTDFSNGDPTPVEFDEAFVFSQLCKSIYRTLRRTCVSQRSLQMNAFESLEHKFETPPALRRAVNCPEAFNSKHVISPNCSLSRQNNIDPSIQLHSQRTQLEYPVI